jgi:hypothetical protein
MQYDVVFDVVEGGYRQWYVAPLCLMLVAIGAGLVYFREHLRFMMPRLLGAVFPYFFLGFSVLFTVLAVTGTYLQYATLRDALRDGRAELVEGTVTEFVPMPPEGHAEESFKVDGEVFHYSDYLINGGFNNTASHGGPIREGLHVRIWHVDGRIARLEIARRQ